MTSTLRSERVAAVLDRLYAISEERDGAAKQFVRAHEATVGHRVYGRELSDLYGDAALPVGRDVGVLVHVLALGRRTRVAVEFGTSLGAAAICIAAALRDGGGGRLITTETEPAKVTAARQNLRDAGLDDLVEVREGDARATLADLDGEVDLLFLDGWNDLYLELLELVEPRLGPGALVIADLSDEEPHHERYREHVFGEAAGYASVLVPLDDGVVVSTRLPSARLA